MHASQGHFEDPTRAASRRVLEGIGELRWQDAECTFAGSVLACMKYLKQDVSYDFVMGVSGGAFKLLWHRQWCPSNNSMGILGTEPVRRTFEALGFDFEIVTHTDSPERADELRYKIIGSIDRGRPVIAWGIVGPPDEGVVTGYDRGGDVLLGRSYFCDGSRGYYEKADWQNDCAGIILIGQKGVPPPREQVVRDALQWAVELARTPESERLPTADAGRAAGLAAYGAWADALRRDGDFPPGDLKVLTFRCQVNNSVTLSGLRDARRAAVGFLRSIADAANVSERHVLRAAASYAEEVAILDGALKLGPYCFQAEEKRLRMADRKLRQQLSAFVLRAQEEDQAAVEHLESALRDLPPA